jgi:hypothetical protein
LKRSIALKNGVLQLTELYDGKIIMAQLNGSSSKGEVKKTIIRNGYFMGLLDHNIDQVNAEQKHEIPVALAYIDEEAGKLWFHYEEDYKDKTYINWIREDNFPVVKLGHKVAEHERLVTLSTPPNTILQYPNGKKEIIKRLGNETVVLYSGKNTKLSVPQNAIIASQSGFAHRSIYGVVSVYPSRSIPNIANIHGTIKSENYIRVERDVQKGSRIKTPSSLIVEGAISSANIEVEGNVFSRLSINNRAKDDEAFIKAGQSLFSPMISQTKMWIGLNGYVQKIIEESEVECLDTFVAKNIHHSLIKIGRKLICKEIAYNSQIYLGPNFVSDPKMKEIKNYRRQHANRMKDLVRDFSVLISELERDKSKIALQLQKLKKFSTQQISQDIMVNRLYATLLHRVKKLKNVIEHYKKTLNKYQEEKLQISFSEGQLKTEEEVQMIVIGAINSGTEIFSEKDSLKIREPLKQVKISVDKISGLLKMEKLEF